MTKLEQDLYDSLNNINEICFGPIFGEFGWEVINLSGFIKKYKADNPNKKVYVATRKDRVELYYNSGLDDIIDFEIEGDYSTVTPRTNTIMETPDDIRFSAKAFDTTDMFESIKEKVLKKHPKATFILFDKVPFSVSPLFSIDKFDYTLEQYPSNKMVIDRLIKKYSNKTPITIFPRHRVDLAHRNWEESKWQELFERLSKENYLIFISGKSPSYVKPNKDYKNIFILEDIVSPNRKYTVLGLTIEAIKQSKFTFGPQTAGVLLSNVLNIPNIYFGKEENLVSNKYNPFNTPYNFINVKYSVNFEYIIDVDTIFDEIIKFDKNIYKKKEETPYGYAEDITEYKCEFPKSNPHLEGLTGTARKNKLREINSNQNYRIPMITTTIQKRVIKER